MQPSNRGPLRKEEGRGRYEGEMKAVVHAYAEVMKLIRHLPPRTRSYYSQFARENFVTYSQEQDPSVIRSLLLRAHHHSCWVLRKVIRLGPIKHTNLTPSFFFSLFLLPVCHRFFSFPPFSFIFSRRHSLSVGWMRGNWIPVPLCLCCPISWQISGL
jgi:hypothetical protein